MSIWIDAARLATAVNVLLLLVLAGIWGRNYLAVRTKHTIGLLLFSVFLLAENAFALYTLSLDPILTVWFSTQVPDVAWRAMVAFHALELLGLLLLTWVTWD
ncbi:MAG: hypothetical protein ABEJ05_12835 [Haloglomus sp.]